MEFKFGFNILNSGDKFPKLGQGVWNFGNHEETFEKEKTALCYGIEHGSILLDTAEQYGDGRSEIFIGKVIKQYDRSKLFIVSKCYPQNAGRKRIFKSCEETLKRLQTTYLDLYLLHWRGRIPLAETAACMNELKSKGLIRHWGVSNFDVDDMEELWGVEGGNQCEVNQVLYHLGSRGIEYDLLPWMKNHNVMCMAYCPVAQAGDLNEKLFSSPILKKISAKHNISICQLLLAFALRHPQITPIPKASNPKHAQENIEAASIIFSEDEWREIESAFPAPHRKVSLDIV